MSASATPNGGSHGVALRLEAARELDRAGKPAAAALAYRDTVAESQRLSAWPIAAEALRRLAVVQHHRGQPAAARHSLDHSYAIAVDHGDEHLAAEALNVLAMIGLELGDLVTAREHFLRALAMARDTGLEARIEQNLGILANVEGDFDAATDHYQRSLTLFHAQEDDLGCALAFHNLGMVNADRGLYAEAGVCFERSRSIAEHAGDVRLIGLCLLNGAETRLALGELDAARRGAEEALDLFDTMGALLDVADAFRVLGSIDRALRRAPQAEARLTAAIDLAARTGSVSCEAEASRELALLRLAAGRDGEARSLFAAARLLFARLGAKVELEDVDRRIAELGQ